MGAAFERIEANQIGIVNPNGQFFFGSLKNFLIGLPDSFNAPISGKISPRDLRQTIGGGYIQDDWRIRPNLTINLGLRYEVSTVPTESQNRLTNLLNLTDASPRLA